MYAENIIYFGSFPDSQEAWVPLLHITIGIKIQYITFSKLSKNFPFFLCQKANDLLHWS